MTISHLPQNIYSMGRGIKRVDHNDSHRQFVYGGEIVLKHVSRLYYGVVERKHIVFR